MKERQALFSSVVVRLITGMAIFLLLLSIILGLYGGGLFEPTPHVTDSYNRDVLGNRAWFSSLRKMNFLSYRLTSFEHDKIAAPLFFVEPEPFVFFQQKKIFLRSILKKRMKKGLDSVVVIPKWQILGRGRERRVEVIRDQVIRSFLKAVLPSSFGKKNIEQRKLIVRHDLTNQDGTQGGVLTLQHLTAPLRRGGKSKTEAVPIKMRLYIPQSLTLRGKSKHAPQVILGTKEQAFILRFQAKKGGSIWVVTDPDLLHNFNIQRAEHAVIWFVLLKTILKAQMVFVDECFHGHANVRSLMQELGRFPHVFMVVQGLLLLALFAWGGARRFGVPHTLPPRTTRGVKEVIQITAWVLVCGQRADRLASSYIKRILQDLAERMNVTGKSLYLQVQKLDKVATQKGIDGQAEKLFRWSELVERGQKRSLKESLSFAHQAWLFRKTMTHLRQRKKHL